MLLTVFIFHHTLKSYFVSPLFNNIDFIVIPLDPSCVHTMETI
jgi:hypothetical protein